MAPINLKRCAGCDREFEPWRHDQRFCSAECRAEDKAAELRAARALLRDEREKAAARVVQRRVAR
jgi:hypothetical protein